MQGVENVSVGDSIREGLDCDVGCFGYVVDPGEEGCFSDVAVHIQIMSDII